MSVKLLIYSYCSRVQNCVTLCPLSSHFAKVKQSFSLRFIGIEALKDLCKKENLNFLKYKLFLNFGFQGVLLTSVFVEHRGNFKVIMCFFALIMVSDI